MPNNCLFFNRTSAEQLSPQAVTHTLHQRYQLVVCLYGKGKVCLEDQIYNVEPGTAVWVQPNKFHRYFDVSEQGFLWLFFTYEQDASTFEGSPASSLYPLHEEDLKIIENSAGLYQRAKGEREAFEVGVGMGRLIDKLLTRPSLPSITQTDQVQEQQCNLLRRVSRYVDNHLDQAIRIDNLAAEIGLSVSHLRKVFREAFDISLGRYLQNSRLTRGIQLIHMDALSISDIAKRSGFESTEAFSQAFNRAIGFAPTAYRKYLSDGHSPIRLTTNPLLDIPV